ncbi:hypothetical protein L2729_06960 [Shewanella gelidimarina]|uniref:hypothetical protein n=1 Tax=Shewanella gelidimarina TaxID=56813 RepID=UPI00200F7305|nr:hypothetical protein [Shewanella gelidimarina]MCL1057740.1 hypothetical protein [Shewanella gelidimarina]
MSVRLGMAIGSAILLFCGCSSTSELQLSPASQLQQTQDCDQTWFEKVEMQILTGDDNGHGPDLGSLEWRSVVEFKLGVRDDESLPEVSSDLWCDYIDEHFIKKTGIK